MTSTTDTTQHPDVSEISELTEGLLSPSRTAEVSRHVDDCALCGDVRSALEEIRGLLGTLPAPARMPNDVADRIDAALAAEASVSRETEAAAEQGQEAGDQEARGLEAESRATQSHVADRPSGHPRAAGGPGRRSARRRRIVLGTALGAAAVGMSVLMLQTSQDSSGSKSADMGVSASKAGASAFSGSPLSQRVHTLLSNAEASPPKHPNAEKQAPSVDVQSTPEGEHPAASASDTPLRAPVASVPACVQLSTGRKTAALAVEEGTYESINAFLVVLPHETDAALVQAYVIDASCVRTDPAGTGDLLLTRTYARP
ncbi:anti-sigma factor family protein [Streptomyces sp. NPDC057580]|uniref:anti-sigma factor family protein n=1 Tax=Streptomyces sp. NPDC057580 TaxID=3346173 RepID=UPI003684425E